MALEAQNDDGEEAYAPIAYSNAIEFSQVPGGGSIAARARAIVKS